VVVRGRWFITFFGTCQTGTSLRVERDLFALDRWPSERLSTSASIGAEVMRDQLLLYTSDELNLDGSYWILTQVSLPAIGSKQWLIYLLKVPMDKLTLHYCIHNLQELCGSVDVVAAIHSSGSESWNSKSGPTRVSISFRRQAYIAVSALMGNPVYDILSVIQLT